MVDHAVPQAVPQTQAAIPSRFWNLADVSYLPGGRRKHQHKRPGIVILTAPALVLRESARRPLPTRRDHGAARQAVNPLAGVGPVAPLTASRAARMVRWVAREGGVPGRVSEAAGDEGLGYPDRERAGKAEVDDRDQGPGSAGDRVIGLARR